MKNLASSPAASLDKLLVLPSRLDVPLTLPNMAGSSRARGRGGIVVPIFDDDDDDPIERPPGPSPPQPITPNSPTSPPPREDAGLSRRNRKLLPKRLL